MILIHLNVSKINLHHKVHNCNEISTHIQWLLYSAQEQEGVKQLVPPSNILYSPGI